MAWTRFMDMHSGGGLKHAPWAYIYIQAPTREAKQIFYARFGTNPERVSCSCCGEDYAITESETARPTISIEEYETRDDVLIIRDKDITFEERTAGDPPDGVDYNEGYC